MGLREVQFVAAGLVGVQALVLVALYLYSRRTTPRETDGPPFRTFSAVYSAAVVGTTIGPLGAIRSLGRLEPYPTPVGPVSPLAVVDAGLTALVVGYVLLGVAFVSPWLVVRVGGYDHR